MSKKPTKKLVSDTADGIKTLREKLQEADLSGQPYLSDAVAFATQAEVMLGKQVEVMGGGTKPEGKPEVEGKKK